MAASVSAGETQSEVALLPVEKTFAFLAPDVST
jgi:hypothetical protein